MSKQSGDAASGQGGEGGECVQVHYEQTVRPRLHGDDERVAHRRVVVVLAVRAQLEIEGKT